MRFDNKFHCNNVHVSLRALCRRLTAQRPSVGASLNEPPPPNYSNWPSIFWRPFLVVTLLNNHTVNNDRLLVVTVHEIHLYGPALVSLFLYANQRIRPFATNKALSWAHLHRDRTLLPPWAPHHGFRGWSVPALTCSPNMSFLVRLVSENSRSLEKFELGQCPSATP